jgi:hypothetical protein
MRRANTAVQRERHITPTIKEIIGDLNGATVFSKLNLNQGYNKLELAPETRYITTFSTHLGLMRYKRLNFGISSAAEIFQTPSARVLTASLVQSTSATTYSFLVRPRRSMIKHSQQCFSGFENAG